MVHAKRFPSPWVRCAKAVIFGKISCDCELRRGGPSRRYRARRRNGAAGRNRSILTHRDHLAYVNALNLDVRAPELEQPPISGVACKPSGECFTCASLLACSFVIVVEPIEQFCERFDALINGEHPSGAVRGIRQGEIAITVKAGHQAATRHCFQWGYAKRRE